MQRIRRQAASNGEQGAEVISAATTTVAGLLALRGFGTPSREIGGDPLALGRSRKNY